MKKLVRGIVEFREKVLPKYREKFAQLAKGQSPDALFITCSDSRVAPNWFASTDPGDLFVVRNVGNLIPYSSVGGHSSADESEAAALEFALLTLRVNNIIICGHSQCGAMMALIDGRERIKASNLRAWLRHGEPSLAKLESSIPESERVNRLSQLNVLQQMEHLRSYPVVREALAAGRISLHGWWFELGTAHVYAYEEDLGRFTLIDEEEAARIIARLS